jgi:chloramphenicol-sensitive protein RarD
VAVIAVENGHVPWLAIVLAGSFGLYGLVKKTVPVEATAGLTAEGLVLGVPAVATAVLVQLTGHGTLTGHGAGHVLLLVAAGPVTAIPLLLYGVGARRIPLSTIGVLMYINPVMQFLWGVLVGHEAMPPGRWAGFVLVWAALAVFTVDLLRRSRTAGAPLQPVRSTT